MKSGKTSGMGEKRVLLEETHRSFIPTDKPKSLVIAIVAFITMTSSVLLVLFIGLIIPPKGYDILSGMIYFLFFGIGVLAMTVCAVTSITFWLRNAAGCYRNIASKPWREQIW